MNPATIVWIIELAITKGVPLAREIIKLFKVDAPTQAQFDVIFGLVKSPDEYLAEARARAGVTKPSDSPL